MGPPSTWRRINRIRMVRKTVDIRYNPRALEDVAQRDWLADCEFHFENLTNEKNRNPDGLSRLRIFEEGLPNRP